MGKSKSTAHFWCSGHRQLNLIGFMTLVERLPHDTKLAFLKQYCRVLPTLADIKFVGDHAQVEALLRLEAGIVLISGASEQARSFALTAFGHAWQQRFGIATGLMGIDLHRPLELVPVVGAYYVDEKLHANRVHEIVKSVWPRILTSDAPLRLFGNLWSRVPQIREELLLLARNKTVFLADRIQPTLALLKRKIPSSITMLELSQPAGCASPIVAVCSKG